ncbi:DUF72 domain-containing protein [Mucilaginibacter roseus]|uniref:DUF72 domain-containing protein n=1 Tax=Mucilaginibacter roseus TaxID=1528868 RepID=A0ABS8TZJ7_9SPHI|nr:DUF72 domain-containing protein [Mucilaginibacter roseus]MCD8739245.1 DUF72 domain-containing protein [Mucilaginibacter roseus]
MHSEKLSRFYAGTSNVELPVKNKLQFPDEFKQRSRLCYYASLFNTVEVNSTFYKLPMPSTVKKWADDVPDNFRFTYKLWRQVTHNKGLEFDPADVARYFEVIKQAGDKKGCLLIQFPPSLQVNHVHRLQYLLSISKDSGNDWNTAVEFRHKSWYTDRVYQLLENFNATLVLHDLPASASPLLEPAADFVYLRFHGPEGGYRGSYSDDYLAEYASYINEWLDDGKTVYTYFNNTVGGAVNNLITLRDMVMADR